MAVKETVDGLAKASVLTDVEDLPGLVGLQERFQSLSEEIDSEQWASLAHAADAASMLLEDIVLRQVEDAEAAFETVRQVVEFAHSVIEAVENGRSPDSVRSPLDQPTTAQSGHDEIDEEILGVWLTECDHSLAELESTVVEVENAQDPSDLIAAIRRAVHTFKGEAGVLSLHIAQRLCHEAESLIDARSELGGKFPVDELLALLDWMKGYVAALAENSLAPAPAHEELLSLLRNTGEEATAGETRPEPQAQPKAKLPIETAPKMSGASCPVEFPSDLVRDENLNDFLCEAREHIAGAEESLLELEQSPEDSELINTVFRAFHTIKGVAGFMNLKPIVEVAHTAETLLDQIRNGAIALDGDYMNLILQSCDMLSQLLEVLEDGQAPTQGEMRNLVERLKRAIAGEIEPPQMARMTTADGKPLRPLGEILVEMDLASNDEITDLLEVQAEGAQHLRELLMNAGVEDVEAAEEALMNGGADADSIRETMVEQGAASVEQIDEAVQAGKESGKRLGELLNLSAKQLAAALKQQRRIRRDEVPEAVEVPQPADSKSDTKAGPQDDSKSDSTGVAPAAPKAPTPPAAASATSAGRKRIDQTVKVNTTRMDNMVRMVGELVIAQQMVAQDPSVQDLNDQRIQRNLGHVGKILRDLQEVAMSLRMVTVKGTFQKMARLVRDASVKSGKKITIRMEGEDTELDRNVVEEIGDPLVHMIRNACDHGIESVDDRIAAGKPEFGEVTLRAFHQGGSIVIELKDDGRGLDREKILAKAIERGIYTPDRDLAEIPDSEIYNLVFLPGFSTADKVTDISGRGVGMDVVRRNIESLRGKAEIDSTRGEGSVFRMRLPLTMAIIDGMIIRVGSQRYVVPTLAIEQSFRPTSEQLHTAVGRGEMVSVRGSLLPVYRLNRLYNLGEGLVDINEALLVVLEANNSRCCLMVDEIIGQQQVVIKSLGRGIGFLPGVSGGAILGDGRVALILDVGGLVKQATEVAA